MDQGSPSTERDANAYAHLLTLWTSGVRDYHSLLSDYLTANSIFVAAIGFLLARDSASMMFSALVVVLCLFGILMAVQMAIVLGRFSAQNHLWEWQLRGIEQTAGWLTRTPFQDLHRLTKEHLPVVNSANDPHEFLPNWATRRHRQWWARREISFPLFFGIIYLLFLLWGAKLLIQA